MVFIKAKLSLHGDSRTASTDFKDGGGDCSVNPAVSLKANFMRIFAANMRQGLFSNAMI